MSVYAIEGSVYWGNTTTPITNLSGGSGRGIALSNVIQKRVTLALEARKRIMRHGLGEDEVAGVNLGHMPGRVTLELRDIAATTLRLLARDLMSDSDTGARSSGGNVRGRLLTSRTLQFAVVPILTTEHMLYLPAATLADGQDLSWLWGRDTEHSALQSLTLIATRPIGQTTPAWMKDTAANVATAYTLTA